MTPSSLSGERAGLQSGRTVFRRSLQAFVPPKRVTVADYAVDHRRLNNPGVNVGRWSHDETPYLVEPMQELTSTTFLTEVVVGPARSGKTSIAENWFLYSVGSDPAHLLWYLPTEPTLASYVKQVINPMIDLHPELRSRQGLRAVDDSLSFKRFRGMTAQFLPMVYQNLVNKSATRIVLDEVDACPAHLGDIFGLADLRRQASGTASMILVPSHPDRATSMDEDGWSSGVLALYKDSDRRLWYWPCAHCNGFSSPHPQASRVMVLDYPQDEDVPLEVVARETRLLCPCCGTHVEDHHRRAMNRRGKWIGAGQRIDEDGTVRGERVASTRAGFWIVGAMSPFVIGGIGALARAHEAAKRAHLASPTTETLSSWKDVVVKRFGLAFDPPSDGVSIDVRTIIERAESGLTRGLVPVGVRFITVSIDVQPNRFELMARGWGEARENWVIDHWIVKADTSIDARAWDELFELVSSLQFPLADGSGRAMRVRAAGCDSGGEAGSTFQAYEAWIRAKKSKLTRIGGRVDGREAWTLLLLKGASLLGAPTIAISYPDSARKDRRAAARGQVPIGLFNPNRFKDDLSAQLGNADPGPGYVHIPAALKSKHAPHEFFEQLVAETRNGVGRWSKPTTSTRNEALDLAVMSHVMAHLWGLARIDWTKPPSWAMPWDDNTLVVEATPAEEPDAPAAVPDLAVATTQVPAREPGMKPPGATAPPPPPPSAPPAPPAPPRPVSPRSRLAGLWS